MGFTLIETMLFLAITGLMVAGMLVGSGVAINSQRYHDAVVSLQSELQDQFSQVQNTSNDHTGNATCTASTLSVGADTDTTSAGASDCYILGRYISAGGSADTVNTLNETTVLGYVDPADEPTGAVGDVAALQAYTLKTTDAIKLDTTTYAPDWDATFKSYSLPVAAGKPTISQAFSVLIVRSPSTGTIRTFINPTAVQTPTQLVHASDGSGANPNLNNSLNLCIDPSGVGATSGVQDVQIAANASSGDGVEILGDAETGNPCN